VSPIATATSGVISLLEQIHTSPDSYSSTLDLENIFFAYLLVRTIRSSLLSSGVYKNMSYFHIMVKLAI
jgi:hypothetical protein